MAQVIERNSLDCRNRSRCTRPPYRLPFTRDFPQRFSRRRPFKHQFSPPSFPLIPSFLLAPIPPSPCCTGQHRPCCSGHPSAHRPPLPPLGHAQFSSAPFGDSQFPPLHNCRQPSVSIGGLPKVQLASVCKDRRLPSPTTNTPAPNQKPNRAIMNLLKEMFPADDGRSTRYSFTRTPIPPHPVPPQRHDPLPDVSPVYIHPPDSLRVEISNTIDVFMPGRVSP